MPTVFDGIAELAGAREAGGYTTVIAAIDPIERRPEAAVRALRELTGGGRLVLFGLPGYEVLSRRMLPFKLVYHEGYDLRLFAHVFPSQKFRLVRDALLTGGMANPSDILRPESAADEDVPIGREAPPVRSATLGRIVTP